ncbi:hypothetical protein [Desulfitobacterium sp.]|uniref:hypothetical protein n=1 Tax=Desulfitobacterium sp. TaxID=49981 RepID=UPI002D811441|nr:hypothetical protein [Desulfitobacterium sp.]
MRQRPDFKVAFAKAGTYGYKLEVLTVTSDAKDSKVLASYEGQVVVTDPVPQQ